MAKTFKLKPAVGWCIICEGVGPIWPTFSDTRHMAVEKFGGRAHLRRLKLYRSAKVRVTEVRAASTRND